MNFKDFLHKDLLEYVISELTFGNLSNAFVVWERHKDEITLLLNDEAVRRIIEAIPSEFPSKLLVPFLAEDFLPPVISRCPSSINIIAEWLINRIYLMETSEKELWPENAKDFLLVFFEAIQELTKIENMGLISFSTSLFFPAIHKKIINPDCFVGKLKEISQKLKWLSLLKNQFQCKLPISNFQESKTNIICAVLDRIDLEKIPNVVEAFARPYALDNEMDLDDCLEQYIKLTFQSTQLFWWIQSKELWEKRLISVNNCIQTTNRKVNSALMIISKASVPWSECVKELAQKGLEFGEERAKEFENQIKLVGLKEILAKYEMKNISLHNDPNMIKVFVNFIFKQNKASAIEDAKKVVESIFDKNLQPDVYYSCIQFALSENKLDDMLDIFEKLDSNAAVKISYRLLRFVEMTLEDKFLLDNNKDLIKNVIYAGIHVIEYLKKWKKPYNDRLLLILRCLRKLNAEFGIYLKLSEVKSASHCHNVVEEVIKDLLDNKKGTVLEVDSNKKHTSIASNLAKIYRLGDILQVHREKVVGLLITHGLQRQQYSLVLKLCQESVATQPSEETAEAIMQVVGHFYCNFDNIEGFSFRIMIDTIQCLNSLAITYCNEDKMLEFMPYVQLTTYLFAIRDIIGEKSLDSSCFMSDSYHKWKFYPFYQDEGFNLQSEIITNFVKAVVSTYFLQSKSSNETLLGEQSSIDVLRNAFENLIHEMEGNSQGVATLRTLILFLQLQFKDSLDLDCSSAIYSHIETLITTIIQNVVSQRRTDLQFVLNLFGALPRSIQIITLKNMLKWCAGDLKRLSYFGKIGIEVCHSLKDEHEWINFSRIYKKTCLLNKKHIKVSSHTLVLCDSNSQASWNLVKDLILSPTTDLQTVRECCDAFQLPHDHVLILYLNHKLIQLEKELLNNPMRSEEEVSLCFMKVEPIIWSIEREDSVFHNFTNLKNKIGPYSYEILLFIEEQLSIFGANLQTVTPVIYQKNIDLLKFLKVYKRICPPTKEEIEYWCSIQPMEPQLPDIANTRLPFNVFTSESRSRIINTELTSNTLALWLDVAPSLNLSKDSLILVAVKNQVVKYLSQYSSEIFALTHDGNFTKSVQRKMEMISKPDLALACVTWIVNKLPSGGNKVILSRIAVELAHKWRIEAMNNENAAEWEKRMSSLLQSSEIERILYKNNLPLEKILPLSNTPVHLVDHLIENYTFNLDDSLKTCKAAIEISTLVRMSFDDVVLKFIFKWLNASPSSSANLDETFAHFDSPGSNVTNTESDEENKIRTINLLLGIPENNFSSMQQSLLKYTEEMSAYTKAKFVFCLVSVFGPKLVAEFLGMSQENLEENLIPNLCSAELHRLGFAYPLALLTKCNKVELIQKVLTSNAHNSEALVFCVKLCHEHNIWHASIWEIILQRLLARSMISLLREVLSSTQGWLIHLWNNKIFINAWNTVICDLLKMDYSDVKHFLTKFYKILLRCPCSAYLNIDYLKSELKSIIRGINSESLRSIESANDICTIILIFKKHVEEQFKDL